MRAEFVSEDARWESETALEALCRQVLDAAAAKLASPRPGAAAVLLTGDDTMAALNARFRGKSGPTNVLSFPAPDAEGYPGDIALGYETCAAEATARGVPLLHHAAHLVVHGFLHLNGHDHDTDAAAEAMEAIEIEALASAGVPDPYRLDV
jgi:probable rRNA maturation factor